MLTFNVVLDYLAYYSETSCDFFLVLFFSIRPTDPISGNAFDGKRRKKRGWPNHKKNILIKIIIKITEQNSPAYALPGFSNLH